MPNFVMRRGFLHGLAGVGLAGSAASAQKPAGLRPYFSVRDFGALGDGVRLETASIQKAIDACTSAGGGVVLLTAGRYLSGTVVLKNNVTLHLDPGAELLGSPNLADYPSHVPGFRSFTDTYTEKSLIFAEKANNIAITGRGRIDGQGKSFQGPYKVRPYMIRFVECRNVHVSDIAIENSPMWVQHYLACDDVVIRGIRVYSRVNANNDGIDIDCCQRVRISDCDISSGDDAIVLKSTADRVTRDVVVTNCTLSTACNALKLGTESNGGFENIVMSNCTIYDTRLAGIALEMVDGGRLDGVVASNLNMSGVGAPIFLRLGDRGRPFLPNGPKPPAGSFRNVILSNIQATRCGPVGCAIAGLPGHCIENVTLDNIRLQFIGGGKVQDRQIPEEPDKYPEFKMFGTLPAYGLYFRHVRGLRLRAIDLSTEKPDARPPMVFDDAQKVTEAG